MSGKRKRFLTKLLLFSFLNLFVTGCAPSGKSNAKPTISVWHWMTDRDSAFQELAKRYEAQTGIKVNFELYAPSDAYTQKVRAAGQGANLPDIFGILDKKSDFASFIKAGHILNLSPYMEANNSEWKNNFFVKALAVNEFGEPNSYGVAPGIYGVPIDIMTSQMLYNKALLKSLGVRQPQNFPDFLAIGK